MKHFKNLREAFAVCEAVGSPVRLEILEQILEHKTINLDAIAKNLHLTNGALTKHIKKLESAGLIRVRLLPGKRGNQKLCALRVDKILIDVSPDFEIESAAVEDIPLGQYTDYSVSGRCGIVSEEGFIGVRDEAASFLSPQRHKAAALWLQKGYVRYLLPFGREVTGDEHNAGLKIREIRISFEISPDIHGTGGKAGFVSFRFDENEPFGKVKLYPPGELRRGFTTPAWFDVNLPQYGTLKLLRITEKGTFMDGEKISSLTPKEIIKSKRFGIETETGFMLFGKGFGDYNQALRCVIQTE
ncbi:MAG: helix-turn-helix domain-containing protein [Firmicutes bacterium]|nr:helix-turn-helix domain-containing protein [Bacillota bacterium]